MKKFPSIESFRHVIQHVRRYSNKYHKPLPIIDYVGTVKLHGSNGGIRIRKNNVIPQGRTRILDIGCDNYGFALFCKSVENILLKMWENAKDVLGDEDITFFGEWCGKGIQKNIGITNVNKHFVIFSVYTKDGTVLPATNFFNSLSQDFVNELNNVGIYFIAQIPSFNISIDFSKPEMSIEALEKYTLEVEEECPWAKFRGVDGSTGEGIVWVPESSEHNMFHDLWFKTKGLKHKGNDKTKTKKLTVDPVKVESIAQFVKEVLPEWRLEQGISVLEMDGLEISPKNTGAYIKWICKDVLKEETDVMVENNLTWKEVQGAITTAARQYYFKEIDRLVGI